jgi:lipopolysaccharide export LptBFGC system permease protein LptF
VPAKTPRYWAARVNRIFSFESVSNASDNENDSSPVDHRTVQNLTIFQFADNGALQALYRVPLADWQNGSIRFLSGGRKSDIVEGRLSIAELADGELPAETNPFAAILKKPSHLSAREMRSRIESSESALESRSFRVALEKRYSTLVLPFIIALFTAPFALSLSRKGKVATVGYAVALWLLFMGITSTFDQFGLNGQLSPSAAVWGPLVAFSMLGIFLMSRVKT